MNIRKKFMYGVVANALAAVLVFLCIFFYQNRKTSEAATTTAAVRTVSLNGDGVDYSTFFDEFEDATLTVDKEAQRIVYGGTRRLDSSLLEEVELASVTDTPEEGIAVRYTFDYNATENEFYLSVTANTEKGEIIDNWFGVPYLTDENEIDIVFATDDGIVNLSDLQGSGVIENCGWFSWLWKAAVAVAVVAVVVAVVVVAAPAVVAAATSVGAAATGAAASAAVSAAAGSAVVGAAVTTAAVAGTAAVTAYLADKVFDSLQEKIKTAVKELKKLKEYEGTMIYHAHKGKTNFYEALTPRPQDIDGLSFLDGIPLLLAYMTLDNGVFITTVERVRGAEFLVISRDVCKNKITGKHYAVTCKDGTYAEWMASMQDAAEDNPHYNTIKLANACYYVGKNYCGPVITP